MPRSTQPLPSSNKPLLLWRATLQFISTPPATAMSTLVEELKQLLLLLQLLPHQLQLPWPPLVWDTSTLAMQHMQLLMLPLWQLPVLHLPLLPTQLLLLLLTPPLQLLPMLPLLLLMQPLLLLPILLLQLLPIQLQLLLMLLPQLLPTLPLLLCLTVLVISATVLATSAMDLEGTLQSM